jgi:hypothetical protein
LCRRHIYTYVEKQNREIPRSRDSKVFQVAVGVYCIIWVNQGRLNLQGVGHSLAVWKDVEGQMARHYGYYSPVPRGISRGRRKNKNQDEWMPWILEANESSKEYRKNWARLIQKIYEVDPLTCPKCSRKMKVISVIEEEDVIKKYSNTLGYGK